ncbi:hypothetical protein GCM10022220_01420 [Actinocatenispora rupis]|uniref:Protein kinase domain-containing protein n=2 Tax=Actinocatenispora rupis TaxID=519421 RepID=A0A8J3J966_9ACTN|nr:hypothetical protein Aru02nite_50960 [Actinocatenispora rupis]
MPGVMSHPARVARYAETSGELALLGDRQLADLVAGATPLGHGIGGTSALLHVAGTPVFVKRIPLSDKELRPEHVRSTANLFDLPPRCQYGVGGHPGFGVWRELAANVHTTGWVLARRTEAFPVLYHWRVLPGAPPLHDELADVDAAVRYWGGAPGVRERIDAAATATASLVLFLEYVPVGLDEWLGDRLARGPEAVARAAMLVARRLRLDLGALNAGGLLHFDAHFGNLRTDGDRLYVVDLGLATSPRFALSRAEAEFVTRHRSHDVCHALTRLVNWLVTHVCGVPVPASGIPDERDEYVARCARGVQVVDAPAPVAALIHRYAPVAAVMNGFYRNLFGTSRATPYPVVAVEKAASAVPELAHLAG